MGTIAMRGCSLEVFNSLHSLGVDFRQCGVVSPAKDLPLKTINPNGLCFSLAPWKARDLHSPFWEKVLGKKVLI